MIETPRDRVVAYKGGNHQPDKNAQGGRYADDELSQDSFTAMEVQALLQRCLDIQSGTVDHIDRLAQALERFNRKERNLLVRAILGDEKENPLRLSEHFRKQVEDKLEIKVPEDAWWSTDYHINWLAGALAIFMKGEEAAVKNKNTYLNLEKNGRRLAEGNQEDVDLLIAVEKHLILIEVKAYTSWDNAQIASKLARLELLHDFYESERKCVPER